MTYADLLKKTNEKKKKAINELNHALNGSGGFLVQAEIERDPGSVAWLWLAKDFCETLADHVGEFMETETGYIAMEISSIYMAYENDDSDLYSMLPVEAQLFTE